MKQLTYLVIVLSLCGAIAGAQVWTLEGPPTRHSHTAVFDPISAQMIIFGGQQTTTNSDLNDVWLGATSTNQSDSFTQLHPTGSIPAGRYGHVAAYDSNTNRMIVFGGATGSPAPCVKDVWILDGANGKSGASTWISQSPSGTAPVARAYAAGAFDPHSNSLIVFGGNNCANGYLNDVWVLSSANGEAGTPAWTKLTISGTAPSPRESASAVYDSVNNVLTVYGGDAGIAFGDVWVLSNANGSGGTPTWRQLLPSGAAPNPRTGQTGVYDSVNNRMTIFGGLFNNVTLTDSWVLTSANGIGAPSWVQIKTTGTAPSLSYHSAVYNPTLAQMYVFAGKSTADKLQTNSHAFTLTGANGLTTGQRWILGGPAVRYSAATFYDLATNSVFVFGGQHALKNLNFNDYWQASNVIGSSNLKWTMLAPKGPNPSMRFGHTGVYDASSDRFMVFGGGGGFPSPCLNDYHVLQHANGQGGSPTWLTVGITGKIPAVRTLHASAYDSATNTLMIFGGYNCISTYFNDVWVLKNANDVTQPTWTQLIPSGTPPSVRESTSAVYDSTTNTLIVYGGDKLYGTNVGVTPLGDLWLLSHANGNGGTPTWTQLVPAGKGPSARSGHTAVYDAQNNLMTVFGGFDGKNVLTDAWVLSNANGTGGNATWAQLPSGLAHRYHSSQYVPTSNEMITFGGTTGLQPLVPVADVDTLTNANGKP